MALRSRTVAPGTRPQIGLDTSIVMDHAVCGLADRRFVAVGDAPTDLHLLASLIAQAEVWIGEQVGIARSDGTSWAELGRLLGTTATAARQRWAPSRPPNHLADQLGVTPTTARRRHGDNLGVPLAD